MADTGKVNIHGKEYTTVAARVQKFRNEHNNEYSIITEIVEATLDKVIMKATISYRQPPYGDSDLEQLVPIATGFAEENRDSSQINRTSALENAETSAIGRALANFGMAGTEYASADEVAQAISQRSAPAAKKPADPLASPAKVGLMLGTAKNASGLTDRQAVIDFFTDETGKRPDEVHESEVPKILAYFKDKANLDGVEA